MSASPIILLCPGQGAQTLGMGREWFDSSPAARKVFADADEILAGILPEPISSLCFDGPAERLNRTDISQPALYVTAVASAMGSGILDRPLAAAAGLSLGEYTALHLAGALSFEAGLRLVALRGKAMQDAAQATPSGMVALIGADEQQAQDVCDAARQDDVLVCANFNAPGQVVISGSLEACTRAEQAASDAGLRATALKVAGAFHSPIMQPAAERLEAALQDTQITAPSCPVLSNVTGQEHPPSHEDPDGNSIRQRLVQQLTSPVRWTDNVRWLVAHVPDGDPIELAPGRTLAGLARRIDKSFKPASLTPPSAATTTDPATHEATTH